MLKHSSRSTRCRFSHAWILLAIFCSTPLVALLVVDLSVSILNLALFCPIRRLARCWLVSASIFLLCFADPCSSNLSALYPHVSRSSVNTLTFIGPVFVSSSALWRSSDHLTIFSSLSKRFLSCCFLYSSVLYQRPVIWRVKKFTPVVLAPWLQFILKPDWSSVLRPSYFEDVLNLHHINFVDILANFLGEYTCLNKASYRYINNSTIINIRSQLWVALLKSHSQRACRRTLSDRKRIFKVVCH